MALKGNWIDKVDGVDYVLAKDINGIAHSVIEVEEAIEDIPENGGGGSSGKDGVTFTPQVSSSGIISWTNDGGLDNPAPVDIKGPKGPQGATGPQGPAYTLTEDDKALIVAQVIQSLGGEPIFGYVDEDNNIIVQGNLADGTYTVKYEMEGGTTVDIGDLVLDSNTYYSVTKKLTNCTISNSATQVVGGGSYSATVTANSGYTLDSVSVTMGGSAVSVSGGVISIASVTGDIVITAVASEATVAPSYTNLLPLSVDADGSDYKGTNGEDGYKAGYKMSTSSGNESAASGAYCSGFMPLSDMNDVVRIKNITLSGSSNVNNIVFYDANKAKVGTITANGSENAFHSSVEAKDGYYQFEPKYWLTVNPAFFRFSCGGISDDTIVTVNEEIV